MTFNKVFRRQFFHSLYFHDSFRTQGINKIFSKVYKTEKKIYVHAATKAKEKQQVIFITYIKKNMIYPYVSKIEMTQLSTLKAIFKWDWL